MHTDRWTRVVAGMVAGAVALTLAGCGGGASRGSSPNASIPAPAPQQSKELADRSGSGAPARDGVAPVAAGAASAKSTVAERMVIRDANLRLEVPKVQDAVAALRGLAKRDGAVVAALQLASDTGDGAPRPLEEPGRAVSSGLPFTASVTLLVPAARFDAFRTDAAKLGKVVSESSADDDVTQQHVDLKARLDNAKAEETRLRSFFGEAKSVTDMLSIERELARVRGDIEAMTAQLASLERQAAMATLTVELIEPKPIVRPAGIDWGFGEALTTGVQAMAGMVKAIIVVVLATLPLWVAAVALFFLIRWRVRARRARTATGAAAETPGS